MADSKITALTAISTVDPAADPLVIVDVSDTSMAASGTTKKATINQLLGASGTATLASASINSTLTVNGQTALNTDLTVTTLGLSTLKVTAAKVGIGTSSPTETLHIAKTTATGAFARFQDSANTNYLGTDNGNFRITNAGASDLINIQQLGVFTFGDGAGGTRMTLNSTGLGVGVVPSAGKGALQLSSGINFPATQVASTDPNTLDDYEEGTWTPTIIGTTTAGTGTYTTQRGDYIKIGRLVTVQFYVAWTAHTGTGNMNVSGLPFTTQNIGTYFASADIGFVDFISMTAGNIMTGYAGPNSTTLLLKQTPTGGGASTDIPIDTTGSIIVSLTYIANA